MLTGSFFSDGEDLRITAQLVDTQTNELLGGTQSTSVRQLLTVQTRGPPDHPGGWSEADLEETDRLKLDVPRDRLPRILLRAQNSIRPTTSPRIRSESRSCATALCTGWAHNRAVITRRVVGTAGRPGDASLGRPPRAGPCNQHAETTADLMRPLKRPKGSSRRPAAAGISRPPHKTEAQWDSGTRSPPPPFAG